MPSWKQAFLGHKEILDISNDNMTYMILQWGLNKKEVWVVSGFKIYILIPEKKNQLWENWVWVYM